MRLIHVVSVHLIALFMNQLTVDLSLRQHLLLLPPPPIIIVMDMALLYLGFTMAYSHFKYDLDDLLNIAKNSSEVDS